MCTNSEISPTLSRVEIRIRNLKTIQDSIQSCETEIHDYERSIESIDFKLEELRADECFNKARIESLLDEARKEGFNDKYLERFLKERRCKLDN